MLQFLFHPKLMSTRIIVSVYINSILNRSIGCKTLNSPGILIFSFYDLSMCNLFYILQREILNRKILINLLSVFHQNVPRIFMINFAEFYNIKEPLDIFNRHTKYWFPISFVLNLLQLLNLERAIA